MDKAGRHLPHTDELLAGVPKGRTLVDRKPIQMGNQHQVNPLPDRSGAAAQDWGAVHDDKLFFVVIKCQSVANLGILTRIIC